MPSMPSDDDAGTRRTDPRPAVASKIPRGDRHNSVMVGPSASPRVTIISPPTRHTALPTAGSKLPRKSPVPSQPPNLRSNKNRSSLPHKQSSLPTRSARTSLAIDTPENSVRKYTCLEANSANSSGYCQVHSTIESRKASTQPTFCAIRRQEQHTRGSAYAS